MEKEFLPYELSLGMEALGFDEQYILACFDKEGNQYDAWARGFEKILDEPTSVLAPTLSQAFRWFRKEHNLKGIVNSITMGRVKDGKPYFKDWYYTIKTPTKHIITIDSRDGFDTYEEAELACLRKLIEIAKENQ